MHRLSEILAAVTAISMGYCALSIWAAARFASLSRKPVASADQPAVSLLKLLKGTDPEMYESFRSHCLQNYSQYELLFGVSSAGDPAGELVVRLRSEFPDRAIRLVVCDKKLGGNGKVGVLAELAQHAAHAIVIVNDSDIRVAADFLSTIVAELEQPNTGLVTCLYRGVPAGTVFSRLESLGISSDFVPGVLVAGELEKGLKFGLGSTLALRRSVLEEIGGFQAIADYLADDYELGKRISQLGMKVALSRSTVETFLPAYGMGGFFSHQLRWARTIRASRPGGYVGLVLTYTLPWAIVTLLSASGAAWAWWLAATALILRIGIALVAGVGALRDKTIARHLWLLPLRDCLAPLIWLAGAFGREISWRGEKFLLQDGKLKRIE